MGRPPKNGIARQTKEERREYDHFRNKSPERIRYTKNRDLKKLFGITIEEFERKLAEQNGLCAICKRPETWKRKGVVVTLSVDHNHKTMKIRGLLCYQCNTALGKLREDEEIIRSMLEYVRKYK